MRRAWTAAAVLALAALACAAPASASVRIEKTVVVQSAPHGGVTPSGSVDEGQSVQETHIHLAAIVSDCDWSLTDPATGRIPGDPFPGQRWKLISAGFVQKRDWALIVRVVNTNTHPTSEPSRHWRLLLRCSTAPNPPACSVQSLRPQTPHNYVQLGFHCRMAARRFQVRLPAGYGVKFLYAADNSLLHEAMACKARGSVVSCVGDTPARTTTWVGLFLTKPVARGLAVAVQVPHAPPARTRTRSLGVSF